MTANSKPSGTYDPPPLTFAASHVIESGSSAGSNSVTSEDVRIVTSIYTYLYEGYEIQPQEPHRNIGRRIQIGRFVIEGDEVNNGKSKIKYEIHASLKKHDSSHLNIYAFKVPREYAKPRGEEFEEWRQVNGQSIAFAQYCQEKCGHLESKGLNFTGNLENFESKLRKKKIGGYFNKYLGESLTEDFLSPPSLEEMPENVIKHKTEYSKDNADLITDFSPLSFKLGIDSGSFDVDISATFAAGKNKKGVKKLAKQDFDFLYDQKKGGLYFNENGADKGFGDGGIIAILKGAPDLTSDNLEFV